MHDGAGTGSEPGPGTGRFLVRLGVAFGLAAMLLGLTVTGASAHGGHQLDWNLETCDAVIAMIPVDHEAIQPHLPDGFTADIPDRVRTQLPPDPTLDAVLGMEAFTCRSGSDLHGQVAPMSYASYWTFADPPGDLDQGPYDLTFVKWDTLIPDRDRRHLLRDHGLPARDGNVTFDLFEPDTRSLSAGPGVVGSEVNPHLEDVPQGAAFDVELEFADGESYRFTGTTGDDTAFRGDFIEYAPTDRALATWTTSYRARTARVGTGTVQLDPHGTPARILSTSTTRAYYLTATGLDLTGGTITLPDGPDTGVQPAHQHERSRDATLADETERHLEGCRDASDHHGWKLLLEVGRECVRDSDDMVRSVIDQIARHVDDCRETTDAMWWEIGRDLRRRCVHRPVTTVRRWTGLDVYGPGPDGGLLP